MDFKLKRLSSDVHNPCYLASYCDVNVLLDCCIDFSTISKFLPSHQLECTGCSHLPPFRRDSSDLEDENSSTENHSFLDAKLKFCLMDKDEFDSVIWDTVDVILISNARSLLGLPFICEYSSFRGRILATEPVVKFGKIMIDDILDALEQLPSLKPDICQVESLSKALPTSSQFLQCDGKLWKDFYTRRAASKAMGLIELVAYHEPVNLYGLLTVCGSSSGFGIGGCNWILSTSTEKVAYVSHTSLLYSHVLPFDDAALRDTDILIIGTVNLMASEKLEKTVSEFRHIVVQTLARGGHVLVPTNPCGLVFDLLETAIQAKETFTGSLRPLAPTCETLAAGGDLLGLTPVPEEPLPGRLGSGSSLLSGRVCRSPVFTVSSQATVSLAYANAYGEWLNAEREALLYSADSPFSFQSLIRGNQLYPLRSLHDSASLASLGGRQESLQPHIATTNNNNNSPLAFGSTAWSHDEIPPPAGCGGEDPARIQSASSACGVSGGGLWPISAPTLMFASHPSLRLGPAVHLLRALVHGRQHAVVRPTTGQAGPRHSVILVESGDYVPRLGQTPSSVDCLRHLVAPYSPGPVAHVEQAGYSCLTLGDSPVTCYWLPMDARVGVHQLGELVHRCGPPRLALVLPSEVTPSGPLLPSFGGGGAQEHRLDCGQSLRLRLSGQRFQPVRLSNGLVRQLLRPVQLGRRNRVDSDEATRQAAGVAPAKRAVLSAEEEEAPAGQASVALVTGLLMTRDGEHWLKSCDEPPAVSTAFFQSKAMKVEEGQGQAREPHPPVYITKQAVDPCQLIKQLTERGVTGAYLADRSHPTVMQLLAAKDSLLTLPSPSSGIGAPLLDTAPRSDDEFILFPNPHTLIQLTSHGSHIVTADESTRKTIRDTLLSCMTMLEVGPGLA